MNPEQVQDPNVPHRPEDSQEGHRSHTYQDDLNQAMNVTEAPVVQEMLKNARDREEFAALEVKEQGEKKVYSLSSILLLVLTIGIIIYGAYYYSHLTVKVQPIQSVGAFPVSQNLLASNTNLQQLITNLTTTPTPVGKPTLINLVNDSKTDTLLSNSQLYSFIGAVVPEPLQSVISVARLGVLNTGTKVLPFVIVSTTNPESASKEFAIAEPNLLQMFGPALNINMGSVQNNVGQNFQSQYFYNLPVRSLSTVATPNTPSQMVFLYGYANNNIIVITTDPQVLKAVYDSLINQH
ncbi:MAG TPA: hypothetical protein VL576_03830 [Candidatus Paceibacterota bacterium]|jgi:hypothetical protein|nr:hypothetical protein [Candidatus Paceibacterota bacterium]